MNKGRRLYPAAERGPADHPDYAETQIIVFHDKPQSLGLLARLLEVPSEQIVRPTGQEPAPDPPVDVRVILGADYDPCP